MVATQFINDLRQTNSFVLKLKLRPTYIHINDHEKSFSLSLEGFDESKKSLEECDVVLTSENLLFCFENPYGLDTTQVNGRMLKPKHGHYSNFYNFFRINQLKSRGENPNNIGFLLQVINRKVLNYLGLYKF